jgi:DNA-directed RNA polymerase subunit RPC12/RpoP
MGHEKVNLGEAVRWESAHVCPECGNEVLLKALELGESTTGIIACRHCQWSGQINIQIVEQRPLS